MCKDNRVSERMSKGVLIDAPFPRNMELAHMLLKKEGYREEIDFLEIKSQYRNQLTQVKYNKSTTYSEIERHFMIIVPDRYIPISKEKLPDGIICSEEDIWTPKKEPY